MLFISMDHRPAIVSPASKAVRPTMTDWLGEQRRSWVGAGVCVFAGVRVYARAYVHAWYFSVRDVFAILYFIQIRHRDDFS